MSYPESKIKDRTTPHLLSILSITLLKTRTPLNHSKKLKSFILLNLTCEISILWKNKPNRKKKNEKGCLFHKYTAPNLNNFKNTFSKILGQAIEYSQVIKDAEHILNFQLIFMPHWPQ